jgi:hypothetical protein
MKNKKILFVTYGGGHSEIVMRITKHLPKNSYKVLALTGAFNKFHEKERLGVFDLYKSLSNKHKKIVDDIIKYLKLNPPNILVEWNEETLMYYSLGALDHCNENQISDLSQFHWNRHDFLQLLVIRSFLLKHVEFKLIVTTTSPRFERASLIIAKELNIPSIQIDDMFANPEAQFYGDDIIVTSTSEVNRLIIRGIDKCKIKPLGNLVYEEFFKLEINHSLNKQIYFCPHKDKLYNEQGKEIFQGNDRLNHIQEFKGLAVLLKNNPGFKLIVRPHPNDSAEEFIEFLDICDFEIVHPFVESLDIAISKAALWITPASTTGIQSSLAGVPTISYKFRNSDIHHVWRMTIHPFIFFNDLDALVSGLSNLILPINAAIDIKNDWKFLQNSEKRISKFIINKFNAI